MVPGNGRLISTSLVLAMTLALGAPAALAQQGTTQPPQERPPSMQPPAEGSGQISDEQLKAFALAATQVREINTSYQPQIAEAEAAKDTNKSATLRKEAQEKMMKAVQEHGLDVDTYNKIYVVARADPEVWGKIVQYMKQPQQAQ